MKKIKVLVFVIVIALTAVLLVSCAKKEPKKETFEDKVAGTWVEIDEDGEEGDEYTFARNGQGTVSGDGISGDMTWSESDGVLTLTLSICGMSETSKFNYKFSGDTLTLTEISEDDDEYVLTLKKK